MNDLIRIENGKPMASSREVAEHFGKEHKNVLQSISNLAAENSATKKMFLESTYENRGKQYPEYLMTRDGFSLLVMGFTGKSALEWKLKYIAAFNKMEEQIKGSAIPSAKPKPLSSVNHAAQIMAKAYDSAIIHTLNVCDDLIIHAPYDRNGHAADYDRYKEPVVDMVRDWLSEKSNPDVVRVGGKNYKAIYRDIYKGIQLTKR